MSLIVIFSASPLIKIVQGGGAPCLTQDHGHSRKGLGANFPQISANKYIAAWKIVWKFENIFNVFGKID